MNDQHSVTCGGHGGTASLARKPRAVVVGNSVFAANAADQFRMLGWDVCTVTVCADLTRTVLAKKASALILPAATANESGHLVAAKIRKAKPKMKIVLVGDTRTAEAERFAKFVGATFAVEADGANKVVAGIVGN